VQPAVLFLEFRTFGHGFRVTKKFGFGFAPQRQASAYPHSQSKGRWEGNYATSGQTAWRDFSLTKAYDFGRFK